MFTMPFKVDAMRHCNRFTDRAERVGAINLMRREADGGWTGDNVDGPGFVDGLRRDGIALAGRRVYLHGCGGVGQNLAWTLATEAIASITLFDIDVARAHGLAERIRARLGIDARAGALDGAACDLAINASPVGLHDDDPLPFTVDLLAPTAVVADVIMEPLMTRLLLAAQSRGLQIHHGRHMMHCALPLAADFYRLPMERSWDVEAPAA
jgi:shikimate dehydrogenase